MSEEEYLKVAIEERNIASKELVRMASHLMKLDAVVAEARRRLERKEFRVAMTLEDANA